MYERQKKLLKSYFYGGIKDFMKKDGIYIAGGAVTSVFSGTEINDIDIYCRDKTQAKELVEDMFDEYGMFASFMSPRAITFVSGTSRYQVILCGYYDSPEAIFKDFDFSINMGAYDLEGDNFVLDDNFLTDLSAKTVTFNPGTKYPLTTLLRVKKYTEKGYNFPKGALLNLGCRLTELSINNWEEYEEQVGGMYGMSLDKEKVKELPFNLQSALDMGDTIFKDNLGNVTRKGIKEFFDIELDEDNSLF